MSTDRLMPWFAPKLSPGISRVLTSIGHKTVLTKGDQIGTSTFFKRIVFVQSGLLAQATINPGTSMPFMLTLSSAGSLGIATKAIDVLDNLPRRYWAVTHCEIYSVVPEIFLRVIEFDNNWNNELNSYAFRRAFCERLGLMVCQAAGPEERMGVFVTALVDASGTANIEEMKADDFVKLPAVPSRRFLATLLNCQKEQIDAVVAEWFEKGIAGMEGRKLKIKASELKKHAAWLQPFLQMQTLQEPKRPPSAYELNI